MVYYGRKNSIVDPELNPFKSIFQGNIWIYILIGLGEIILIVYLARYWDIFYQTHTFYNIIMKLLYILSIIYIIYLMKYKYK